MPLLARRLPIPVRNAAFDALSVPMVRGKRSFKDQRHVDVALEFALLGYLRHGRNFVEQQLTANWPTDKVERAVLTGLAHAQYLFAQVESVKEGEGLGVKDAFGAEGFVRNTRFSKSIQAGMSIAGFVYTSGDMLMLTGTPFILEWKMMEASVSGAAKTGRVWKLGTTPGEAERTGQMEYAGSFIAAMLAL